MRRKSKTRGVGVGGVEPNASPARQKPSIMSVWCSVCLALSSRDICCLLSPASWPGQGRRTRENNTSPHLDLSGFLFFLCVCVSKFSVFFRKPNNNPVGCTDAA